MRQVGSREQFTPMGLFIREHCRQDGLVVTNIDYVIKTFTEPGKLSQWMLVEEKQNNGRMGSGQFRTFHELHGHLQFCHDHGRLLYRGFFKVSLPCNKTIVGPGVMINDTVVTVEQLVKHLNFEELAVPGLFAV